MIRIIDNKRVEMTDTEWQMYQNICQSYSAGLNKGEDLFKGLFETNQYGIITLLKPPTAYRTSFEVYLFIMGLMQQQHLRLMHKKLDEAIAEMKEKSSKE